MNEEVNTSPEQQGAHANPQPVAYAQKLQFAEVVNDSWQLFQTKFWNLFGINLMMTVIVALVVIGAAIAGMLLVMITLFLKIPAVTVIVAGAAIIGIAILALWAFIWQAIASFRYLAADGSQTVMEALNTSKADAREVLPTALLSIATIIGGYVLLIIPGIILSISLSFVMIVAILENKRLWDALITSRDLVRGRWLNIFFITIAWTVLVMAIIALTGAYASPLMVIVTPFAFVVSYVMYKKLKSLPLAAPTSNGYLFYKVAAVVGVVAIVGAIVGIAIAGGSNWDKFKQEWRDDVRYDAHEGESMHGNEYMDDEYPAGFFDPGMEGHTEMYPGEVMPQERPIE